MAKVHSADVKNIGTQSSLSIVLKGLNIEWILVLQIMLLHTLSLADIIFILRLPEISILSGFVNNLVS
jgi:hypothetical protein